MDDATQVSDDELIAALVPPLPSATRRAATTALVVAAVVAVLVGARAGVVSAHTTVQGGQWGGEPPAGGTAEVSLRLVVRNSGWIPVSWEAPVAPSIEGLANPRASFLRGADSLDGGVRVDPGETVEVEVRYDVDRCADVSTATNPPIVLVRSGLLPLRSRTEITPAFAGMDDGWVVAMVTGVCSPFS